MADWNIKILPEMANSEVLFSHELPYHSSQLRGSFCPTNHGPVLRRQRG